MAALKAPPEMDAVRALFSSTFYFPGLMYVNANGIN
jgi:hypothetical protein